MGIFGNLFNNTNKAENKKELPWIPLNEARQIASIMDNSAQRPQFIFKHSTTCGISRMVINMFTDTYAIDPEQADLYYLDLHAFRGISNQVAQDFNVVHQSPQLLVIKDRKVVFHTSHGAISEVGLEQFL